MARTRRGIKRSFQGILNNVASENAFSLLGRARTANRIAKGLDGESRQRVYQVKVHALLGLTVRFPGRVQIVDDSNTPKFVVVVEKIAGFGLHAPASLFGRP
ncbi:MAG: hypothetical protein QOE96_4325 [Blastocatellia bacterium]|jgi:hypothetical protein|nr:hypothetical protein [Blastocatellia bacterium]